jgi:hypothetical protein
VQVILPRKLEQAARCVEDATLARDLQVICRTLAILFTRR